jgi:hypothetical protein
VTFDPRRHSRQVRLVEIGEAGQARLGGATVAVGGRGTLGAEVEARYLAGAGVGTLIVADEASMQAARAVDPAAKVLVEADVVEVSKGSLARDRTSPTFDVGDPAARDIAEGAWRALRAIREALAPGDE